MPVAGAAGGKRAASPAATADEGQPLERTGSASLAASPFQILDARRSIRLVLDQLDPECDALAAALTARPFRDAVFAR